MKTYIKGNFRKSIFKSDKGYIIGLFKVRETNNENIQESINKTIKHGTIFEPKQTLLNKTIRRKDIFFFIYEQNEKDFCTHGMFLCS